MLAPTQERAALLTTMPGVSDIVAQVIVAEIGVDMSRFPSPGHLLSWAGLCPRNDESAGKRHSTRVLLRYGVEYRDLGSLHFGRRDKSKTIRRLVQRLTDLGCDVEVKAHAA